MKFFFSVCLTLTLGCLLAEAYPQKKKDLDKRFFREGKSDLLQGCTPQQLLALDQENIACYKRADALVSRPDNFKDVCNSIDAKLKCLENNVGKCLNEQGRQNIRLTFLKEQVDKAKASGQVGLENECPTLVAYKSSYVDEVFGAQKCAYDYVTGVVEKSNECNKLAQEKWAAAVDKLVNDPNKKALFTKASCDLRREVDACNVQLYACMSDTRIASDKANWDHLEAIFTETQGIGEFTFNKNCNGL